MPYTRQRYSGIIKQNAPAVRSRYNPYPDPGVSYTQEQQQPIGRYLLGALQALDTAQNEPQQQPIKGSLFGAWQTNSETQQAEPALNRYRKSIFGNTSKLTDAVMGSYGLTRR